MVPARPIAPIGALRPAPDALGPRADRLVLVAARRRLLPGLVRSSILLTAVMTLLDHLAAV